MVAEPNAFAIESLAELVEEFLRRRRLGEALEPDSFAARADARASELRELLESADLLENAKTSVFAPPAHRPPPEVLGDFRIVGELGRGGMGLVYEAEHVTLGRRVALKVMAAHAARSPSRVERFQREARTAARLHHTNIVPIFGVGEHDGVHFYVMQLIRGCGLDQVIAALRSGQAATGDAGADDDWNAVRAAAAMRRGWLGIDHEATAAPAQRTGLYRAVAQVGAQVADALSYAHGHGTLHRDIKPANLLLDATGQVWVTDFGLAKANEDTDMTLSGDLVGTLQYMAPEQLEGRVDARTDVYCLGLTLYELLTLHPAYGEASRTELLRRIVRGAVEPPSKVAPGVPRDLETIVLRAIAREPHDRYQDAGELASDLRAFLDDRPIRARRAGVAELAWRWCRRNRVVAALAALAFVGLVSTAVVGLVGAVRTGQALARAEDNMRLALTAFEHVFAGIIGPDLITLGNDGDGDGDGMEVGLLHGVSEKDAAVLQRLLQFYDHFAEQGQANAALRQQTARAHQRVGEIHLQLGNAELAATAYRRALSLYEETGAAAGLRAQLLNDLGRCLLETGDRAGARQTFERVLALDAEGTRTVRFEQARAHDYVALSQGPWPKGGERRPPPFERPPPPPPPSGSWRETARAHHRAAQDLLGELLAAEPQNSAYRLAKARGLRFLSFLDEDREAASVLRAAAISILESLLAENRNAAHLRAELASALAGGPRPGPGRERRPAAPDPDAMSRYARAGELVEGLVAEFPTVRAYRDLALEVLPRLAQTQEDADPAAAAAGYARAVALLRADASGDAARREVELRTLQISQAAMLVRAEQLEDARRVLADMASWVDQLDQLGDGFRVPTPRGHHRHGPGRRHPLETLGDLYAKVGDATRATRLRELARHPR